MTWFDDLRRRFRQRPPVIKTVIDGQQYEVSEVARRQAAINFRLDPEKRAQGEAMIGVAEMRRRYPESYQ